MTSRRRSACLPSALAVAAALCALPPSPLRANQAQEHVFATVVDARGRPVAGLNASDFTVEIDGRPQEVLRAEQATTPLSIVVLTDRLGLNPNYTPVDLSLALRDFVKIVRAGSPESRFALTTFDGPVIQVTKFTSAPAELDRALGRLSTMVPSAALLDALSDASQQLSTAPTERRMIMVVLASYRQDQSSLRTDLAAEQLRVSKGSLWAVEVRGDRTNFSSQAREEMLDNGSQLSGGLRDVVSSRSGVLNSCKHFAELMVAQYDVTYGPAGGHQRSRLAVGVKGSGLRVLAPSWLSR
jgi:VWFA-related protein